MSQYDQFAEHYDLLMGDRADIARDIRYLLRKEGVRGKTLLELGCGTGSILQHFSKQFQVTGVDLSASMLKIARKKVPNAELHRQNIARLRLTGRYDIVLCIFDTMNHLTRFGDWKSVFRRVRERLSPEGVFLFDINTVHALELYAKRPAYAEIGERGICIYEVFSEGRKRYRLELRLLKKGRGKSYTLFETEISELAVPTPKILRELRRHFRSVSMWDAERSRAGARTEELYFICRP